MVEEYMLLANIVVGEIIYEKVPKLAILRKHGSPDPSLIKNVIAELENITPIDLDMSNNHAIIESLDKIDNLKNIENVKKSFLHYKMMKILKRANTL